MEKTLLAWSILINYLGVALDMTLHDNSVVKKD